MKYKIKEMLKTMRKVQKIIGDEDCGNFYCYKNERNKCPVYNDCRMLDLLLINIIDRLEKK